LEARFPNGRLESPQQAQTQSQPRHSHAFSEPYSSAAPSFPSRSALPPAVSPPTEPHVLYAQLAPLVRRLLNQYGQDPERKNLRAEIYSHFDALLQAYDPQQGLPVHVYLVRHVQAALHAQAHPLEYAKCQEVFPEDAGRMSLSPPAQASRRQQSKAPAIRYVRAALPEAIEGLPVRQQQVVRLRYYQGCSLEKIAELLGISVETARSLLRQGLNTLRRRMRVGCECA
jgi:RNA polymerase sigma factor (sigma-70 family)